MKSGARLRGVVFDLDGTLLDSFDGIAASLDHARTALGLDPLPAGAAQRMIGHGLERLIEQAFPTELRERARDVYRAHYDETCVAGTRLLPGAMATLTALRARGLRTGVATNKPTHFARKLLDGLGLAPLIEATLGADTVARHKPAPDLLLAVLAALEVDPPEAVYVGDMHVDMETARNAGVRAIGVATGAQTPQELRAAGAAGVVQDLRELLDWLDPAP